MEEALDEAEALEGHMDKGMDNHMQHKDGGDDMGDELLQHEQQLLQRESDE